jgi:nondiscriminating glutamyl-tRNA synthetase
MSLSVTPRVRFAPSPTGRLHVGGARTALFNWLYARHHGGTLVLRIEDTDVERSTRDAEAALLDDLRWLGIDWDEGPDRGGPHPPYRQSERLEIYQRAATPLLDSGGAFLCFCSDDELERKRAQQVAAGEEPRYDGACRALAAAEVQRRRDHGEPHTIRFRVPTKSVRFHDRVRGDMHFESNVVGDFVLVRSNGLPTYNFACVVDDDAMRITQVIRGEDHLSNTLRQVMLYEALGLARPEFAHVSLILGEDRTKLKKRAGQEGTYVDEYRTRGWLPEALVNFLALLGWSSTSGEEILSPERLCAEFDLDRVSRSPAVFDVQKLRWMGGEHLRATDTARLGPLSVPFLRAAGLEGEVPRAHHWVMAFRDGIACMAELPAHVRELLDPGLPEPEAAEALRAPGARRLLPLLAERVERSTAPAPLGPAEPADRPLDGAGFKALVQDCGRELSLKGRDLFMPVRAALSGRTHGPELPLLFDALGQARVVTRLRAAANPTS